MFVYRCSKSMWAREGRCSSWCISAHQGIRQRTSAYSRHVWEPVKIILYQDVIRLKVLGRTLMGSLRCAKPVRSVVPILSTAPLARAIKVGEAEGNVLVGRRGCDRSFRARAAWPDRLGTAASANRRSAPVVALPALPKLRFLLRGEPDPRYPCAPPDLTRLEVLRSSVEPAAISGPSRYRNMGL